ncbi:hypothetical protein TBLA_0A01220 [Henningerozyma blattae CBS 6284]|uniref:Probable metalloreductase AIM14 n=1 Tax=Henningerozyma blattae (strain ATCC 34711 / CBS 6284 / DSM 70876 / NBRC 10599 / NRRL Y-10934 / UCD 77-7) TaxID=1071380 RepID=I2GUX0_HENB6|nr:hypothetical protein TBLA_0A01220 [Tetrapisispora blattae CBS 6284]CCH57922.1 hypothetical protein TBLA_0A01220 [Tetrapisispora blattae CBS 6284]
MKKFTSRVNIRYGYYPFVTSLIFFALLVVSRRLLTIRYARRRFSLVKRYNTRNFFFKFFYELKVLHLSIYLLIPLVISFVVYPVNVPLRKIPGKIYYKRLGRLSYVLASLNLLITLRSNILLKVSKFNYTDMIPLHKWLSRFIFITMFVHSLVYMVVWHIDDIVVKKMFKNKYNLVGFIIFVIFCVLFPLSIRFLRRKYYKLFYMMHHLTLIAFIFLTPYHARPSVLVPYFYFDIAILAIIVIQKLFYSRVKTIIKKVDIPGSNLKLIKLPKFTIFGLNNTNFAPASHLRISPYHILNPLFWMLPTHPFSIASLPGDDTIDLIVKENSNGKIPMMKSLKLKENKRFTITKHFESAVPVSCLNNCENLLIIVGGSGIGYGLPIYRYFQDQNMKMENGDGNRKIKNIRLYWVISNHNDLKVLKYVESLKDYEAEIKRDFHIYITRESPKQVIEYRDSAEVIELEEIHVTGKSDSSVDDCKHEVLEDCKHEVLEDCKNEVLEDCKNEVLEDQVSVENDGLFDISNDTFASVNYNRRPNWNSDFKYLDEFDEFDDVEQIRDNTWILGCGPNGLIKDIKLLANRKNVNYSIESFEF